jgi:formyltetrahydrofolate deformylase
MTTHILLIDCPDEKGLVYRITGQLSQRDFNIISNHEFVDASTEHFFMRTAFEGSASPQDVVENLRQVLPAGANIRLAPAEKRPIVLLVTREPHCLGDLLLRHAYDELPARICAVVGNRDTLAPLAQKFGIPFHYVSHEGREREEHEREILEASAPYQPDYLVLAKYMRVLTPHFVAQYPNRIINIHHSFLPAFTGANPYRQAFERGVKIIGATAHIVTDDLDTGPILVQNVQPVDHSYSAADMAQAGRDIEKIVLSKALKLVLEERVFLHHNRAIIFE